ncbi:hypothetical protein QJS04_geneDACA011369 [Acorus gramineus]|uniref:Uncharacterized protein n=1 Tax=Acorus gramineus TaxID=55184 RepID=A0AAV9ANA2_ACOGR|nr:hypothetical protein QJS04_geneDACA011369 [Acorus gramineus]
MALSCSRFGFCKSNSLSIDSSRKAAVFDVRWSGLGCRSPFKVASFSVSFDSYKAMHQICLIRSELHSPVGAEHVDPLVTVPRGMGDVVPLAKDSTVVEAELSPKVDIGGGGGGDGNGKLPPGGGGGGGGGGDSESGGKEEVDEEFGPVLKFEEVMREMEARGVRLPSDMLEAAKTVGLQKVILFRYLDMQNSFWPLGFAMKSCFWIRNRMLADPAFLFKVGTEIVIDTCCATFAEVQKRGKDFWAEFELYAADILVGLVVNVALVGLLAPYARIGRASTSNGFLGRMSHAYGALPSSATKVPSTLWNSLYLKLDIMDNSMIYKFLSHLAGVFLAVSSNTRYQIINGLERLVETSPVARQVPPAAMAFTVGVRFANNVYGGMQFVDWARWSGCQ